MDELIRQITERTGISQAQAQGAAETVLDFVEQKLPAPLAGQVRGLLNSDQAGSAVKQGQQMLDNLGGIGGLFGKK